jgi:hypothetical protein
MVMFKPYIKRSNYIELIHEERDDSNASHQVLFRVKDSAAWELALIDLLRFAEDEEDYAIRVRKEYAIKEGRPTFFWSLDVGGMLDTAYADLGPILCDPNKKAAVPPAPVATKPARAQESAPGIPASSDLLGERRVMTDDGIRIIRTVRLPFATRGPRNNPGEGVTKKFGDKRKGAYVTVASGE